MFVLTVDAASLLWSFGYFWLGVLVVRQGSRVLALLAAARARWYPPGCWCSASSPSEAAWALASGCGGGRVALASRCP